MSTNPFRRGPGCRCSDVRLVAIVTCGALVSLVGLGSTGQSAIAAAPVLPTVSSVAAEVSNPGLNDVQIAWGDYGSWAAGQVLTPGGVAAEVVPPTMPVAATGGGTWPVSYRVMVCSATCPQPPPLTDAPGVYSAYVLGPWWRPTPSPTISNAGPTITSAATTLGQGVTLHVDNSAHLDAAEVIVHRDGAYVGVIAANATSFTDTVTSSGFPPPFDTNRTQTYTLAACYSDCLTPMAQVSLGPPATAPNPDPVPDAVTNLAITSVGHETVNVSWTPPANVSSIVRDYIVMAHTADGSVLGVSSGVQIVCATCTVASLTGLPDGVPISVQVAADTDKNGVAAATAFVTPGPLVHPGPPTGTSVVAGNGEAIITWVAPNTAVDQYVVVAFDGRTYVGFRAPTCATCTTISYPGLHNGHNYAFAIFAHNAMGYSIPASTNTVTPGETPTALVAHAGLTTVDLSWTPPGGAPVDRYVVLAYDGTLFAGFQAPGCGACTTLTYPGLTTGHTYTFAVFPHTASGFGAAAASPAVTTGPSLPTNQSGQVGSLAATVSGNRATITWTAPPNAAIDGYTITLADNRSSTTIQPSCGARCTSYTAIGLYPADQYVVIVAPRNSTSASQASAITINTPA